MDRDWRRRSMQRHYEMQQRLVSIVVYGAIFALWLWVAR